MPHSGGGGSHGGGSHGGSGGSSHRTSSNYFPGSRRYRRHYHDGRPDEYFYSNGTPVKTTISSIIMLLFFGVFFLVVIFGSIFSSRPKKLTENYTRPSSRIIDNIDIIDNDDELEKVLEAYNDSTGICPVVYTMYTEDYKGSYSTLERFAYDKYVSLYSDERHYLFVYAIPKSQAEDFKSGALTVPDYEWESMIGDDTDALYDENGFVHNVHTAFEKGGKPGKVFANAVDSMRKYSESRISGKISINPSILFPLTIVILIFGIPLYSSLKKMKQEKEFDYEEAPFSGDEEQTSNYQFQSAQSSNKGKRSMMTLITSIPFAMVGAYVVYRGKVTNNWLLIVFGIFWFGMLLITVIPRVIELIRSRKKDDDDDDLYD